MASVNPVHLTLLVLSIVAFFAALVFVFCERKFWSRSTSYANPTHRRRSNPWERIEQLHNPRGKLSVIVENEHGDFEERIDNKADMWLRGAEGATPPAHESGSDGE